MADVQLLVANAKLVKGVGAGHSWWAEQFCAGSGDDAVDVILTEIADKRIVVDEIGARSHQAPAPSPTRLFGPTVALRAIAACQLCTTHTLSAAHTAKVDAGIVTHDFLDYLSKYGRGWALGNHPWFTFQTIGGAVATGSHGSSMTYGSLSSDDQLLALDVVLANGTLAQFSKASHPFLWKALQVSVGRLGIITALTFKIVPNEPMYRWKVDTRIETFLAQMKRLQDGYIRDGDNAPEVEEVDGVQYCAFYTRRKTSDAALWRSRANWVGKAPRAPAAWSQPPVQVPVADALSDAQLAAKLASGAPSALFRQPRTVTQRGSPLGFLLPFVGLPRSFGDGTALSMAPLFENGTYPARTAIIAESLSVYTGQTDGVAYDQYEASVPMSRVHTCFSALNEKMYGPEQRWRGLRAPGLIRFVKKETGLLSHTTDGSRVYLNIEDYVKYQSYDAVNQDFQAAWAVLRSPACQGRMHWGKTGWPESGFVGAREYPTTWCDFGCAVRELDPNNKFRSASHIWDWSANDMQRCCIQGQGFNHDACTCK